MKVNDICTVGLCSNSLILKLSIFLVLMGVFAPGSTHPDLLPAFLPRLCLQSQYNKKKLQWNPNILQGDEICSSKLLTLLVRVWGVL